MLALRVTGVSTGDIGLEKQGNLLRVRFGQLRRSIMLPDYLAGLQPGDPLGDGDLGETQRLAFARHQDLLAVGMGKAGGNEGAPDIDED